MNSSIILKCVSTPPRFFQTNLPYHIYNRGNRKGEIFLGVKDYQRFVKRIKEYKELFNIDLLCYCLMPNHFHFILIQHDESAITNFMLRLATGYSKYFNIKHELVGRLFQERYRAKLIDTDEYLIHLSRYIHLNPVSDNPEDLRSTPGVEFSRAIEYPWSSLREYLENETGLCNKSWILNYFSQKSSQNSYTHFIKCGISEEDQEFLTSTPGVEG